MTSKSKIIAKLKQKGYRITKLREAIIEVLIVESPLTIKHLTKALKIKLGTKNINIMSIYNNLEALVNEHIVFTLTFNRRKVLYELAHDACVFALCEECSKIAELDITKNPDLITPEEKDVWSQELKKINWSSPVHYKVELHSLCNECQNQQDS